MLHEPRRLRIRESCTRRNKEPECALPAARRLQIPAWDCTARDGVDPVGAKDKVARVFGAVVQHYTCGGGIDEHDSVACVQGDCGFAVVVVDTSWTCHGGLELVMEVDSVGEEPLL